MPVFAFTVKAGEPYTVFDVSERLRTGGWQVPAYTMPDDATDVAVIQVVIRDGFSYDLADDLLEALAAAVAHLTENPPQVTADTAHFSHT
jgi:glutamate decarboxylase